MEESAVTVDGRRHQLPDPFFVVATQNPSEQYGTFPLPEGQIDRFAVALTLGPLDAAAEKQVVREQLAGPTVDFLNPVVSAEQLVEMRAHSRSIHVSEHVLSHALALVRATREDPRVALGASPRAALALVRCAQAQAVLAGRDFVLPDDVEMLRQLQGLTVAPTAQGGLSIEAGDPNVHDDLADDVAAAVQQRVLDGMGLVVLHSGHLSKPFKRLMGTSCNLRWREDDDRELVWTVNPAHPVARGVPPVFAIERQEMYGEFFDVPPPDELVFISSFTGGEVFRSGCCFLRGKGRIFFFSPGHEHYPVYHHAHVRRVVANAVLWSRVEQPSPVETWTCVESPSGWFEERA